MRVAAIDCGTNSIRLLAADVDPATGTLVDLDRRMEIVRLGQDVDRTGRFAPEALARTFDSCDRYAAAIKDLGCERVRFVATSASRDVSNRDEFAAGVLSRFGVEPDVVSGDEEAYLSFIGATRELAARGYAAPYLVIDIGGGSTEFILGADQPEAARSVNIGCVRLTERHLHDDPPTAEQVAAARVDADAGITEAAALVPLDRAETVVGVAGTVTTVAAMALDLPRYDSERIHLSSIALPTIHGVTDQLLSMTHDQRHALPFMHPGRVDVIGAGSLILDRVLHRVGPSLARRELVVSEHDILDGIAFGLAG